MRIYRWLIGVVGLLVLGACSQETGLEGDDAAAPSSFSWTRGTIEETRMAFLRNFGVGYGYNAVSGRYCNYDDIRCQVLNRRQLERAAVNMQEKLFFADYTTRSFFRDTVAYSDHDYVAIFNLDENSSINCVVYSQEQTIRQNILEDGLRQNFYYCADETHQVARQWINVASTKAAMQAGLDPQNLLTASFRDAVRHLGDTNDPAAVDSFIRVYGTHVVVGAAVGGRLHIDLKNSMKRYSRHLQDEQFKSEDLLLAFKSRSENRQLSEQYAWVEDASINVTAYGGDQSVLTQFIGPQRYDGSRRFDVALLSKWSSSITFVPDNEYASNAEMIDMEVVPIWEFVFDADAAAKLRTRITSDAALARKLLGEKNFASCSFPLRHDEAKCQVARRDGSWETVTHRAGNRSDRHVVFVVSGGRYVAMQSYEYLSGPGISGRYFWTVYPVYGSEVKLYCGLAVSEADGSVYRLVMGNDGYVRPQVLTGAEQVGWDATVYLNAGQLSFTAQQGYDYAPATPMLYVEPTHGVNTDGTVDVSYAIVDKPNGNEFEIEIPADGPQDIGEQWTLVFTGYNKYKQVMNTYTRSADFAGNYNPREVRPVQ